MEAVKLFLVGVAISRMRRGHALHTSYSPEMVQDILDAVALQYNPNLTVAPEKFKRLESTGRSLVKNLPRSSKKQVETLVNQYLEQRPELSVERWVGALYKTDYRLGLLMCGDVRGAVWAWHLLNGIPYQDPADAAEALAQHGSFGQLAELLAYAVSDAYFTARKATGMAV